MSGSFPYKILHVCNSKVYGGGEEHVRTSIKYLRRLGCNVSAAVPAGSKLSSVLKSEGVPVFDLNIRNKFDFRAVKTLIKIIKDNSIDIVHTHNRQEDLVGAVSAFLARVKIVTTIHDRINMGQDGRKVKNIQSCVYHYILRNFFHKLITVSKATYEDIKHYAKVPDRKIIHVVNGLDLERIKPSKTIEAVKNEVGVNINTPVIGFVARIRGASFGKKGISHLIEAAPEIIAKYPDAAFVVSGEDEPAAEILKKICGEKKVLTSFRFIGYRNDIIDIMSCFDILVCPSLFEGLPRVVLEAMAMGIAVVGSNVDGIPEVIIDNETGYLVEPKDSHGIAEKVIELLNDGKKRKMFGEKGAERIFSCFRAELSAEHTISIYNSLFEDR